MILIWIFVWVGAALLEVIGDGICEWVLGAFCGLMTRTLPMRIIYGASWRWRARQVIADRRNARGSYLRNG